MNISVFIPTYNYAAFLPQAIESVLAQTLPPVEIVVADDGSTDDTAAVVARYADRVAYRRFEHRGVYALRDAMIRDVQGDWFFNLDADKSASYTSVFPVFACFAMASTASFALRPGL